MINLAKMAVLAILAVAAIAETSRAAQPCFCLASGTGFLNCQMPLTKSYRVPAGCCPQQMASLIAQCVPLDGPAGSCGPYGIPPIYTAGNFVLVRQTPAMHERITAFLVNAGVPDQTGATR